MAVLRAFLWPHRRHQVGWGDRVLRACWPPGPFLLAHQALMSSFAGSFSARDGVVRTELMTGGSLSGGFVYRLVMIRPEPPDKAVAALLARAAEMGYERFFWGPSFVGSASDDDGWHRFQDTKTQPRPTFKVAPPGAKVSGFGSLLNEGILIVPEDASGIIMSIDAGFTMTDGRKQFKSISPETRARMAELGIDADPPPPWQRFWFWWWARTMRRLRLNWTAWRLGAFRGELLRHWKTGGPTIGPYTVGTLTLRRGQPDQAMEVFTERAQRLGYTVLHDPEGVTGRHPAFTTPPGRPTLHLATYQPGERITTDRVVLKDHTGIIMSLTA